MCCSTVAREPGINIFDSLLSLGLNSMFRWLAIENGGYLCMEETFCAVTEVWLNVSKGNDDDVQLNRTHQPRSTV